MSETTLRDTIQEAFNEQDETPVETPAEINIPQDSPTEQTRDQQGRFTKPGEESPLKEQQQIATEVAQSQTKPRPSSWKKDYDQAWAKLASDPELAQLQDYISQREGEYAKGVSTYKNQWDQAAPIVDAMQQFMPDLQQNNIAPAQWITNLGMAHKTLAMGSPEQKLQMFAKLANDYGVPLQALNGQQVDPQFSMMAQKLSQIENQWTQFQTQQQQAEQASIQHEIDTFKQGAEHFEEVRETMAQLLDAGVAKNLQDAYDKAVRFDDALWAKQQAKQAPAARDLVQVAAEKKAKAVSPRSAAPTGSVNSGSGKKGLRETLAEQLESAMGGRV